MSNLQDRAKLAVSQGRAQRIEAIAAKQDNYDSRGEFTLTYDGYAVGRHWGRLANGGRVPITPISPGTIQRGEVFVGVRGAGGEILASWMP